MFRGCPRRSGCLVVRALQGAVVALVATVTIHFVIVLTGPNFHTVLPNRVYRSGQLSPAQLESYVRKHHIRTVVSLRGCCVTAKWYRAQTETLTRLDLAQEDLSFSAVRLPSMVAVRQLIEVIERTEPPLLFHCHQGADRTGLASVIALLLLADTSLDEATRQLGPLTGHVPLGRTANIGRFFEFYREWLAEMGYSHSSSLFRLWATEYYCPDKGRADFELLEHVGAIQAAPGKWRGVTVRCRNTARKPWRFEPGITAGMHGLWRLFDRECRVVAQGRTGLRRAVVDPGDSIDLAFALPPLPPGSYQLCFDLVEEQHASFLQLGNDLLTVRVEVK